MSLISRGWIGSIATSGNMLAEGDLVLSLGAGNIHEQLSILAADLVIAEKLKEIVGEEGDVRLYEPLAKHTTLRVGGPAQFWVEPRTEDAFAELIRFCRRESLPLFVIGRGSNLLVRDGGIRGVVVHPMRGEFDQSRSCRKLKSRRASGAKLKEVAYAGKAAGLGGFEWMEGIPGEVGGGLRMNAGAMGAQTFEHVVQRSLSRWRRNAHSKKSPTKWRSIIGMFPRSNTTYAVSAVFRGTPVIRARKSTRRLDESQEKRRTTQPSAKSAGCIFKNPASIPAGKLVDELGLKNLARRRRARLRGSRQFYRQRRRRDRGRSAGIDRQESKTAARAQSAASSWKPKSKSWGKTT